MKIKIINDCNVSTNTATSILQPSCCSFGTSTVNKKGIVYVIYRNGQTKHSYDGVLLGQFSADKSKTWSEPVLIFDGKTKQPVESVISSQVTFAPNGSLFCVFSVVVVTKAQNYIFSREGFNQQRKYYKSQSIDNGLTWSEPQEIVYFNKPKLGITGNAFVLPNGDIFINTEYPRHQSSRVIAASYSSDNGNTVSAPIDIVFDENGLLNFGDPFYCVFDDGMVMGLFWTFREDNEETVEVHRSVSLDNGRTWSKPLPVGMLGQISVPMPVEDDKVIVTSNYRQEPEGIKLWISHDRGVSFKKMPMQIWDPYLNKITGRSSDVSLQKQQNRGVWQEVQKFSFGSPDLVNLNDGTFILTYYATVSEIIHIRACRFKLEI